MPDTDFYVYEHWRSDEDRCFYVGKGRGKRAWQMSKRNEYHRRSVSKLRSDGCEVSVVLLACGLTEADAFALEVERIAYWRAVNCDLTNLTAGGEGLSGFVMPDKVKLKISAKHKGKILSEEHRAKLSAGQKARFARPDEYAKVCQRNAGRKQSAETIAKRAAKLRGRKMPQAFCDAIGSRMRGKVVSKETRAKLRAAQLGRRYSEETKRRAQLAAPNNKPVRCLNTGAVYVSAAGAARALGVNKSHVAEICRGNSVRKSASGYKFEYTCGEHEGGV